MKTLLHIALLAGLSLTPVATLADNGKGKGKTKDTFSVERVAPQKGAKSVANCPPGLAKKAVPCVPPGQVKNWYKVGDRIERDYVWIDDPYRYGLKRGGNYVRAGDYVYSIDPDTRKVLNLIGAVADILY
ncbi:hypothetical protein [Ruegeria arenilitoris]|uniref:hypothetical protein n=1 Tax=Ruegeria arenilitoris TaxID=1173585 RepID=UPI00147EC019|nr:hypothetical protein [Ruegeria arenilitoris]